MCRPTLRLQGVVCVLVCLGSHRLRNLSAFEICFVHARRHRDPLPPKGSCTVGSVEHKPFSFCCLTLGRGRGGAAMPVFHRHSHRTTPAGSCLDFSRRKKSTGCVSGSHDRCRPSWGAVHREGYFWKRRQQKEKNITPPRPEL